VPHGYLYDARRLASELGPIWDAFLRGQITIAVILGLLVGFSLAALGVHYAPVLGILATLMEFIPIVGPLISTLVGVLVAVFQPDNLLGLSPIWYAVLVLVVYSLLQQIQNNVIIPRILGRSLHLHPIVILIGAFVAASLAGVVGLLLSAPTIATLRLFGRYVYRKLFDIDPWPPAPPEPEPPPQREWLRWLRSALPKKESGGGETSDY